MSEAMTFLQVLSLVSQAGPAPSLPAPTAGEGPVMGCGTPGRVTKSPPPVHLCCTGFKGVQIIHPLEVALGGFGSALPTPNSLGMPPPWPQPTDF